MRAPTILFLALLSLAPLTGCVGSAEGDNDPFAYMRKPLYASSFSLDDIGNESDSQEFRVQDGSIFTIHAYVWVNATAGSATVTLTDPSGREVRTFDQTGKASFPMELGAWHVKVTGADDPSGRVDVRVVRG